MRPPGPELTGGCEELAVAAEHLLQSAGYGVEGAEVRYEEPLQG